MRALPAALARTAAAGLLVALFTPVPLAAVAALCALTGTLVVLRGWIGLLLGDGRTALDEMYDRTLAREVWIARHDAAIRGGSDPVSAVRGADEAAFERRDALSPRQVFAESFGGVNDAGRVPVATERMLA